MTPTTLQPVAELFSAMRPREVRTMREFAEQEITLPTGPEKGDLFSTAFMPWTGKLLDEFSVGRYREFWISGPVQDGKTTIAVVIPLMYYLFEMRKNVIFGVPRMELAQGKWEVDIKPMIESSRNYAHLLPEKGRGSRGGKFEVIYFRNGTWLRFMAGGGGDEQRSSFTSEVVIIDEIDKMDEASGVSRETDKVSQIRARAAAFDKVGTSMFFGACTMSTIQGRINQEVTVKGTDTKVYVPCPHCHEYIVCQRENFRGWQGAKDVIEACEKAVYVCQECKAEWTEADRLKALRKPVFAARGQTVDRKGVVHGKVPRTFGFGFSWNTMYSGLKGMSFIAKKEYETHRSEKVDAKKDLMQFAWALPWEDEVEDLSGVTVDSVLAKIGKHPRGVIPPNCSYITAFIDTGMRWLHWMVWAWTPDAQGYCLDYGEVHVSQSDPRNPDERMVLETLKILRDEIFLPGWTAPNGDRVQLHLVLVDAGWKNKITYAFIRESNELSRQTHSVTRYFPSMGLGTKRDQRKWHQPKPNKDVKAGPGWFIRRLPGGIRLMHLDSDGWKAATHNGFRVMVGNPGSLSLYKSDRMEHFAMAKQIVSERCIEEMTPRGPVKMWIQKGANHWFDCAYGALAGAHYLGVSAIPKREKTKKSKRDARTAVRKPIRYKY